VGRGGHQQQCRRSRRAADPGQAGDYLRTGEGFIRRLIAERRICYVKLGKHVRLQRSALNAFIQSGRVPSALNVRP